MTLLHIVTFAGLSLPFMWLVPAGWRPWGLLVGSVLAAAWFVADDLLTGTDFMLMATTLLLILAVWWVVRVEDTGEPARDSARQRENRIAFWLLGGTLVLLASASLLTGTAFSPGAAALALGGGGIAVVGLPRLLQVESVEAQRAVLKRLALLLVMLIILILVVIKVPALAQFFGFTLDWQAETLATATPFVWLGFSYMAFRLMAVLLDYRAGRLPKDGISLRDMATYVLFFPAFTAGPIDRAGRFVGELNQTLSLESPRLVEGMTRIAVGAFKKFVIADSLALVAMNPALVDSASGTASHWLLLYLYTFQIFFDFSGYSDVAIGLGRLYGITLPENFDRPYTQRNIQQFWQRWHITLSTWFRVYVFTPLSRALIRSRYSFPQWSIVLICQIVTMGLIGLWHGATLNFLLWGLWHGLGLFLHKQLADNTKAWNKRVNARLWSRWVMYGFSVLVTFHFVALGWVFFALPTLDTSLSMFQGLFGLGG